MSVTVDKKPGWKTTEFWFTLLTQVAGLFLIAFGNEGLGTALMGGSKVGYDITRGIAKLGESKSEAAGKALVATANPPA